MEDFIKALRENKAYDWIANNGWKLSKDELITIIKEYDFALPDSEEKHIHLIIATELEEREL